MTGPAPAPPAPSRAGRRRPRRAVRRGAPGAWRRTVRPFLFWCHLAAGVAAGVVILVMSATGVLLAYQRQLVEWSAGAGAVAPPAPGARPLPLDPIVGRARAVSPEGRVTAVTVRDGGPVAASVGTRHTVYLDPYTGAVREPHPRLRELLLDVERWHRSLATGPALHDPAGARITGAANLAFLFLLLSGLVLWIPRQRSWRAVRAVLLPQPGATGRRRDWSWHHVLGAWSASALAVVVLSGVFISYRWPTRALERLAGAPASPPAADAERAPADSAAPSAASLDRLLAAATRAEPGWATVQIRLPAPADRHATVTIATTAESMRPDRRTTLTLDRATAKVEQRVDHADLDAPRRVRAWMRWLHTGEALGVIGQTIAMLASAAAVGLVWTGLALALRRLRARFGRRGRPVPGRGLD